MKAREGLGGHAPIGDRGDKESPLFYRNVEHNSRRFGSSPVGQADLGRDLRSLRQGVAIRSLPLPGMLKQSGEWPSRLRVGWFAVEGLFEAMADELRSFCVRVIIVAPRPFQVKLLGRSKGGDREAAVLREFAAPVWRDEQWRSGGDPDKAIAVLLQAIDAEEPPLHLPLVPTAHAIAERNLAAFRNDIDK